jgi:DNA-binding NarL/FixJ family response regulator
MRIQLTTKQKAQLEKQHEVEEDGPKSDRMKAVLLSSEGWEFDKIGQVLRVDEATVASYLEDYLEEEKLHASNGCTDM